MYINLGTLNARGGGNKINFIIHLIKMTTIDILALQEMHIVTDSDKRRIEREGGGTLYLNNGTGSSRGVATFIRHRTGLIDTKQCETDMYGRKLINKIDFDGKTYHIINQYSPNAIDARNTFYLQLERDIETSSNPIILGDYNCVLDRLLDRTKGDTDAARKADKSRETLRRIIDRHNIVDSYRHLKPVGTEYTFTGSHGYRARLDRIYINTETAQSTSKTHIQPIKFSDHDLFVLTLGQRQRDEKWGRGNWKLNNSLLMDKQTKEEIHEFWEFWQKNKYSFRSSLQWWDEGKRNIKEIFIENGKRIQNEKKIKTNNWEGKLKKLLEKSDLTDSDTRQIHELKGKLRKIEEEKMEACRIRCREEWIDYGERCTKYFYDLERRNGELKVMKSLKTEDGNIVTSKEEICDTALNFYSKLYKTDDVDEDKLQRLIDTHIDKKLTDEQRDEMEGYFKKEEVLKSLKEMKNNKAPGLDGLSKEFYIAFWDLIGTDLLDVYSNIHLEGKTPTSMTEGLITMIYKEKGDINDLKNWRPITLLNVDYKLMTKTLANRMRQMTDKIINPDQGCGIKGRTIHDQLYFIQAYIDYYKENNLTGMLVTIDQEKAFDKVHHTLIHKMLEKYNFGPMTRDLVKTIYSKMTSRLQLNGLITDTFQVTRSVRQGDGLSMILFVLTAELLAQMIRNEMDITPINLPNTPPKKVTQYADDTTIMTTNINCLYRIGKVLELYENRTGAKINGDKTEILLIGKWTKRQRDGLSDKYKNSIKEKIKILGVWFGKNSKNANEEDLTKKIKTEIDKWTNRDLSMTGKITVLRTLVLSKLWHVAKVTSLQRKFINDTNKLMSTFLWYPKTFHSINRNILQNDIKWGGIDFPNIDLELDAYFLERISIAIGDWTKPWVGMLKYRLGNTLCHAHTNFSCRRTQHTDKQTAISTIILKAFNIAKNKIMNWEKLDYTKIKTLIKVNIELHHLENLNVNWNKVWQKIRNSSRDRKRIDLNYRIAHRKLPLAHFLTHIGFLRDDRCRLCSNETETQKHLFLECTKVHALKLKVERELTRLTQTPTQITYVTLVTHDIKGRKQNELLSIYKQCIWQTRAALHTRGQDVRIEQEMESLFYRKVYDRAIIRE